MSFDDNDDGPFWLDKDERDKRKYDSITDTLVTNEMSKTDLLIDLKNTGVDTTKNDFSKLNDSPCALRSRSPQKQQKIR